MRACRSEKGFTIIELMIVLAIGSIIMGMGITSYIKILPHLHLKTATRDVASILRLARSNAISDNKSTTISVSGNALAFNGKTYGTDWVDVEIYYPSVTDSYPNLSMISGKRAVTFLSDGTTTIDTAAGIKDGEAVYLKNIKETGEKIRVTIDGRTGIVKSQKWIGSAWI
ncbi:MAG TPA: GspH/FimT family pseudopilin [Nitrospirota bacterium]